MGVLIALAVLIVLVLVVMARALIRVQQAQAYVIERLGKFHTVLNPGLNFVVPFFDAVRSRIDLREQVVSFPPQPVITEDNLTVNIDTVIYFQVTDPRSATYEISNYIQAVEQLTVTTLRNVVGGMNLEETLTSRDRINGQLRGVLDEATGRWGIRVNRVELKAIDPPPSIQDSMEKQMRADRDKRAMILQAEGQRESAIKSAEGQKQAAILSAEGQKIAAILTAEADRQSRILRAEGERAARYLAAQGQAKAIETVFSSIHDADPDPKLLAYQYLQMLPQIAQGDANKLWIVPSEFGKALEGLAKLTGGEDGDSGTVPWLQAAATGGPDRTVGAREQIDTSGWFEHKSTEVPVPPEATSSTSPGVSGLPLPDTRSVAQSAVEEVTSAPASPTRPIPPADAGTADAGSRPPEDDAGW
jgi:regulator of protease activity HflC (stomatin/prohibitin superfamily)